LSKRGVLLKVKGMINLNKTIKYTIEYEHLKIDLVKNEHHAWHFNQVKNHANKYRVELSDKDFERLFKLQMKDKDIEWMLHKMGNCNVSLIDTLVSYITY